MITLEQFNEIIKTSNNLEAQKFFTLVSVSIFGSYRAAGFSCEEAWKKAMFDIKWMIENKKFFPTLPQDTDGKHV